jgi:adenosylcobinamide-phosphate synthase
MFSFDIDKPAVVVLAVLLDSWVGEPIMFHPLVGFGNIATKVESLLFTNRFFSQSVIFQRVIGVIAVATVVVPIVLCAQLAHDWLGWGADALLLYLAIGAKSLRDHSIKVLSALADGDIALARQRVSMIVSRNTDNLGADEISKATIESVLENGSDAIFGAIFWFVVFGPAGAVLFRLANTLDAMWGYKSKKYLHFGWAAARFDDILCWIPARLTALSYAFAGDTLSAIKCWQYQAKTWYSPNAGPVMSAGAGALRVRLGGAAIYDGVLKERPLLGNGSEPTYMDISRSIRLVRNAVILWLAVLFVGGRVLNASPWW